ncbi:MAG TPA: c-type cytochrome [Polyangiaceae bacterium]|jgi:cytochrome c1|nr:c-type cytochrome [Polyangiaceae bacterium]
MTGSLRLGLAVLVAAITATACETSPERFTWGDSRRGANVIQQAACGSCHVIPGIRAAHGLVGPPLETFSERTYIAEQLPNTPVNLAHWIRDPQDVEPRTAMPNLGLTERQSLDVAAYLFTLR